jgi:hypothetical protein
VQQDTWINHPTRGPMAAMFYELTIPETYQAKKYDQSLQRWCKSKAWS